MSTTDTPKEQTMSPTPADTPADTSVKVPHLVLGLLFLGAAATWALLATGVVDADALPYLGPGLLVAAGVVGLAVSVLTSRRRPGTGRPSDHAPFTMEDHPAPGGTRRLEQQHQHDRGHDTHDDIHDGKPTAPLHRPEDLR